MRRTDRDLPPSFLGQSESQTLLHPTHDTPRMSASSYIHRQNTLSKRFAAPDQTAFFCHDRNRGVTKGLHASYLHPWGDALPYDAQGLLRPYHPCHPCHQTYSQKYHSDLHESPHLQIQTAFPPQIQTAPLKARFHPGHPPDLSYHISGAFHHLKVSRMPTGSS